jgi:hypothetical protein
MSDANVARPSHFTHIRIEPPDFAHTRIVNGFYLAYTDGAKNELPVALQHGGRLCTETRGALTVHTPKEDMGRPVM